MVDMVDPGYDGGVAPRCTVRSQLGEAHGEEGTNGVGTTTVAGVRYRMVVVGLLSLAIQVQHTGSPAASRVVVVVGTGRIARLDMQTAG